MKIKTHTIYRIVIFLPTGENFITTHDFLEKLNEAVPISYGDYDSVAYYSAGTERFRPLKGANPTSGKIGQVTELPSTRVEISIPRDEALLDQTMQVIMQLHPWEKPVLQIYEAIETIEKEQS